MSYLEQTLFLPVIESKSPTFKSPTTKIAIIKITSYVAHYTYLKTGYINFSFFSNSTACFNNLNINIYIY